MSKKQFDHRAYHHFNRRRIGLGWLIIVVVIVFGYFTWASYQPSVYLQHNCRRVVADFDDHPILWFCPNDGSK